MTVYGGAMSRNKKRNIKEDESFDDETKMAHVVLQRYSISNATVSTNGKNLLNVEIPYSEFKKVNR